MNCLYINCETKNINYIKNCMSNFKEYISSIEDVTNNENFIIEYETNIKNLHKKYKDRFLRKKNLKYYENILKYILYLNETLIKLLHNLKDKDVTIIIGETKSGKSTLINYFNGCKMIQDNNSEEYLVIVDPESKKKEVTKIAHGKKSTHLYPEVVRLQDGKYVVSINPFSLNLNNETMKNICLLFNNLFFKKLAQENSEKTKLIMLWTAEDFISPNRNPKPQFQIFINNVATLCGINNKEEIFRSPHISRIINKIEPKYKLNQLQIMDQTFHNTPSINKTLKRNLGELKKMHLFSFLFNLEVKSDQQQEEVGQSAFEKRTKNLKPIQSKYDQFSLIEESDKFFTSTIKEINNILYTNHSIDDNENATILLQLISKFQLKILNNEQSLLSYFKISDDYTFLIQNIKEKDCFLANIQRKEDIKNEKAKQREEERKKREEERKKKEEEKKKKEEERRKNHQDIVENIVNKKTNIKDTNTEKEDAAKSSILEVKNTKLKSNQKDQSWLSKLWSSISSDNIEDQNQSIQKDKVPGSISTDQSKLTTTLDKLNKSLEELNKTLKKLENKNSNN